MNLIQQLAGEVEAMRTAGTFKTELELEGPQGALVKVKGKGEVVMLTSNNYLGLANHPEVVEAAEKAEKDYGYGLASVRFICGTQDIHKKLEARIAKFFATEDTILYGSCWNANEGLFQAVCEEQDGIFSDELNHASIIDGIRLSKARRLRYKNLDADGLDTLLSENTDVRRKLIMTDGVFSMEGSLAPLPRLVEIARKHDGF